MMLARPRSFGSEAAKGIADARSDRRCNVVRGDRRHGTAPPPIGRQACIRTAANGRHPRLYRSPSSRVRRHGTSHWPVADRRDDGRPSQPERCHSAPCGGSGRSGNVRPGWSRRLRSLQRPTNEADAKKEKQPVSGTASKTLRPAAALEVTADGPLDAKAEH